ncbi:MAG: GatB/YqeY domain-containing protein [Candidatus Binatia bacterium]
MPLTEQQLAEDLTRAMKAREALRVSVLRGVIATVKNARVEKRGAALDEAELHQVVRREVRKREEAAEFAEKAGRTDILEQTRAELAVLAAYVPAAVDLTEIESAVREITADPARRTIGAIMSVLRERYAGRFDGRQASEIAKRVLAEAPRG